LAPPKPSKPCSSAPIDGVRGQQTKVRRHRLGAAGLSPEAIKAALQPVRVEIHGLHVVGDDGRVTEMLVTALAFFPPTSPLLMPMRLAASSTIPAWQPVVSAVLAFGAAIVCVWVSGRIFRVGILSQGKAPGLRELWRWAIRG
jgi:hypothetical protein